jgi:C4-dicarboxylate-specific signal transduction histidine kinase
MTITSKSTPSLRQSLKPFQFRYASLRGYALLGLLLLVLILLSGMIWRNLEHFELVHSYVGYSHRILQVSLDIQEMLTGYFRAVNANSFGENIHRLSAELDTLSRDDYHMDPDTPARLREVRELVLTASLDPSREEREAILLQALSVTGAMLDAETVWREDMLDDINRTIRTEIALASVIVVALLAFAALFLKFRVLAPLHDLKELLLRIAREDFTPFTTDHLDPLLAPVFRSYNEMLRHLADLEEIKRDYATRLEGKVRMATQALLEQHVSLARAERLAAVGELAAGIAHELRNPLAGIQISCANLRQETSDPEHAERLDLVISELKRMGRLLNELLGQSQHTPAPVAPCHLPRMLDELMALVRYQIQAGITVEVDTPPDLILRIPECRLRQTLLNLILNAAQALGSNQGVIRVGAEIGKECVVLTVADNGPGFSQTMLEEGIRPFSTGRAGGSGLGLVMVRRFAHEVGGQMELGNVEPHGACVRLILPGRLVE